MSNFTAGQRVRLARRYEIEHPGIHFPEWDRVASVGTEGLVQEPEHDLTPYARPVVPVLWPGRERHALVWEGCLEIAEIPSGTRVRISSDPRAGWDLNDGARGYVNPRARGQRGIVTARYENRRSYQVEIPEVGFSQCIWEGDLTPLEDQDAPEAAPGGLPTTLEQLEELLQREREDRQKEIDTLALKAMDLGRRTDMCGVLEKFCDDVGLPIPKLPMSGTVTVTYRVTGKVGRQVTDYDLEYMVQVNEDGSIVSTGYHGGIEDLQIEIQETSTLLDMDAL